MENINIVGKECIYCGNCKLVCPKNAIVFKIDDEGFEYPFVDNSRCVNCKMCLSKCPIVSFSKSQIISNKKYFYGNSKETNVLMNSSSGGIFYEICKEFFSIYSNAKVVGATIYKIDKSFRVKHIIINNLDDIQLILKSKYMQSDLNNTFSLIKRDLVGGINILFSGTPCQCSALISYLGQKPTNLFIVDFVCHGVPSKKILDLYLTFLMKKYKREFSKIDFRDKTNGWDNYGIKVDDLPTFERTKYNCYFYKAFLSDIALRECCYNCNFKNNNRSSDVTLGDYRGYSKKSDCSRVPFFEKGVSIIIANTVKGEEFLGKMKHINLISADESILNDNPSYYCSSSKPFARTYFLKNINEKNFVHLVNKQSSNGIISKISRFLKRMLKLFSEN